jgi:dTDP-L-rhamnose 4-epimerase
MKVLVTGGAGFIGSHVVDLLIEKGHSVVILDNLSKFDGETPKYINKGARLIKGDVKNVNDWRRSLRGAEAVIHLAALIDGDESIYHPSKYVQNNILGAAKLMGALKENPRALRRLKKILLGSSVSVYGEGYYYCSACNEYFNAYRRERKHLDKEIWDIYCDKCKRKADIIPSEENMAPSPVNPYAITKLTQEYFFKSCGTLVKKPVIILRYSNVYGPRSTGGVCNALTECSLNLDYSGVLEDGKQLRNFIHAKDVAEATILALEQETRRTTTYNIGSAKSIKIKALANMVLGDVPKVVLGWGRTGDVRHSVISTEKMRTELGFRPKIPLKKGLKELREYVDNYCESSNDAVTEIASGGRIRWEDVNEVW